ncbi:unnamed protein product [Ixodes pacificus]
MAAVFLPAMGAHLILPKRCSCSTACCRYLWWSLNLACPTWARRLQASWESPLWHRGPTTSSSTVSTAFSNTVLSGSSTRGRAPESHSRCTDSFSGCAWTQRVRLCRACLRTSTVGSRQLSVRIWR